MVFCLILVISLLHISCANERRSQLYVDNHIEFDTITVSERQHLDRDTQNPYCDIHISFVFPVDSRKVSTDTLQRFFVESVFGVAYRELSPADAVQQYVRTFIENFNTDARIFREDVQTLMAMRINDNNTFASNEEFLPDENYFSYYERLSNTITYNQHGILAFQVVRSNKRGGTIAFRSYHNYVFNLQTGKQMVEYDIFNSDFELELQRFIIASLLEQNGVRTISELENIGFFGIEEIVPNGNFLICDRGITYTFNKGEYSIDQISAPVVFIPYRAIRSLLRRGTVVARLADL